MYRNISGKGAFNHAEVDQHGYLVDASVDALQNSNNMQDITRHMHHGYYKQYATCDAKKIIQKGGRIRCVPSKDDPNHCQIHGLNIKTANNLFSNHEEWQ